MIQPFAVKVNARVFAKTYQYFGFIKKYQFFNNFYIAKILTKLCFSDTMLS